MTNRLTIGKLNAGLFCGERLLRVRQWYKYYGLFRKFEDGSFSLGPILFWKDK
jgi:hypothetical protein